MHFSLFFCIKIWTLSFFNLGVVLIVNYVISFLFIYDIWDYLVIGDLFYEMFSIIDVSFMQLKLYLGHH